ncbi:MAG: Ger(x)C family spore germination protein [Bacillota bacterium]
MKLNLNRARCLLIGICILTLMLQTGCRSKDEIEDLSIYVGMGLDEANKTELETKLDKLGTDETKKNLITFTLQIVEKQSEAKGGKAGSDQNSKPYINVSETGDSLFQLIREFTSQMERPVIGHHLKVIVINEQLAGHISMHQLLDFFLRDNDIRPSTMVLMSSGPARKTLEAKGNSIIPSFRLMGMIDNRYRTLKIIPPMTLSTLQGKMHAKSSYLLQNVIAAEGEVKFSGAAVIKGKTQKFRGLLSEEELLGVTWLTGKGKGGLVKSYDEKTKQIITYEMKTMKSKIRSHIDGDNVSFDVDIESEGRLIEDWTTSSAPIDEEFKKRAEQAAEKEVKRLIQLGLDKIQKKYKADVVGFGTRLNIEHPKHWQKVKQDWDNVFSEVPITYKVKLNITEMGAKKSH